jgi:protein SCO1/2
MKGKSIFKILILVSILAVPGFLFFYLLPNVAKNRYKKLPVFGDKQVAATFHTVKGKKIPDTVYHTIPDFNFKNQVDSILAWDSFDKKIVVINLFYTNTSLQTSYQALQKIADGYQKNPLIKFLSVSVDPKDTPQILNNYAKSLKLDSKQWNLVSGDTSSVYKWIKEGLLLDVLEDTNKEKSKYIYSNQILLIDNQHRIRGFYDASNKDALAKLDDEIKVLVAEDLRNINDGR